MSGFQTARCRSRMHEDRISTDCSDLVSQNKASASFTRAQGAACQDVLFNLIILTVC